MAVTCNVRIGSLVHWGVIERGEQARIHLDGNISLEHVIRAKGQLQFFFLGRQDTHCFAAYSAKS